MKRMFSLLLAAVMVLTMLPAVSLAAADKTVYWDPVNGNDANSGLSEAAPVKTVEAAYAALEGAEAGRLILLDTLTLTTDVITVFPECDIPVTITSKTGAEGINTNKTVYFSGDTTLENMTLTLNASNNTTYLSSQGHNMTIGEGITCKNASTYRFCLTTQHGEGSNGNATLTVKSGNWRNIFYGGYTKATTGDATLVFTGGHVNNLVGPSFSAKTNGNMTAYISGGTITTLMSGPNETGNHTGNVDIHLSGGTVSKVRLRRVINSKVIPIYGTVTVHIEGDCSNIGKILDESASGKIDNTVLVLKKGILDITPTAIFNETRVEILEGETMKLVGSTIEATSVDSAGTLIFSGAASLTADSITGSLNCEIEGDVQENHPYVTAPAASTVHFPEETGVTGKNGVFQYSAAFDTENFKGLVLKTTVSGISVKLFQNYNKTDDKLLTPVYVENTEDGGSTYYYEIKALNRYYLIAKPTSGYARYNNHYNLYFTEEEAATKTVMDVTPNKRSTNGWDPSTEIRHRTSEVMDNVYPSDASLWPQYAEVFTTPAFQPGRNENMQTTQTEFENFIEGLDDPDDNMYVYTLGQSAGKAFDIPLVIFTTVDLSGADTLEEAAALIRADSEKNGKLTVHHQAQIHGNEPAAGEAALGMLLRLDGAYGEGLLDTMNIYMIPRLSPYGAYKSQRAVYVNGSSVDPNRDFLRLRTAETQLRMVAYNLFEPEVVFDSHEYQESLTATSHKRKDLMLCTHWMPNHDDNYKGIALDLANAAFTQVTEDGLYYSWYSDSVGGMGGNTGSSNTAIRSSFHILMETSGINQGLLQYERRVATHVSALTGLYAYLDENAGEVKEAVRVNRQQYIENGKTYREDDIVILDASSSDHKELNIPGKMVNLYNGTLTDTVYPAYVPDVIVRSRIAPTAYVIPAGESYTQTVLNLMDKQGIAYRFIPAGSALLLQQYTGTVEEAYLAEEKLTCFKNGAYVFTMDQVDGYILAILMEPDVNDTATDKGTLVQQGIITATNGMFPIYRYIHDLNGEGFVDYTVVEIPVKEITVYVDNTNGLDTNDGLTAATPVKTLEQAYALMDTALTDGGAGSNGTVVISGLYDLGTAAYSFPEADYPVTFMGLSTNDGISFTGSTEITDRMLQLHGDTTFQHIRLHSANPTYTNNFIFANGHKLIIGEGVNSTCVEGKLFYFTLVGGSYDYDENVASTDITVKSGTWRMIYGGGYRGSVTGTVKLDITNASVYAGIFAAYVGSVGNFELKVSDTKVTTNGIFAGTYTANGPHKIGYVLEGSTVTVGKNVTAPAVYGSARTYGSIYGGATVIADGVDLATTPLKARYASLDSDYGTDWLLLKLAQDVKTDVTLDPAITLDLCGHDITGNVTVDGTLTVKDSATDDYDVSDGVYGEITGTVTGTLAAAQGYVAAAKGFHRFDQYISGVALRPGNAGIYYTATVLADEVLRGEFAAQGVAVSLTDLPGADFETDPDTLYTTGTTGVMVQNILKGDSEDADRGIMDIYAASYVKLNDGTVLVSDGNVAYSLYDVLLLIREQNPAALDAFIAQYHIENWFK